MLTSIQLSKVMVRRFLAAVGLVIAAAMLFTGTSDATAGGAADSDLKNRLTD